MPEIDGLEATIIFRRNKENLNFGVPVLTFSENSHKTDKDICLSSGMDDIIAKPVFFNKLGHAIKKYLK